MVMDHKNKSIDISVSQTNININAHSDNVVYIPMGFDDSSVKKVCEWFPPGFLIKQQVFAIQEVEPLLLKLYTRVHENVNKIGRKRGGRKVLLLGKEVFGDTFLACGRCGYHSADNSNVRKHHRRQICLLDRGYDRSQLLGMSRLQRTSFLQRLSSRRYRHRCRARLQRPASSGDVEAEEGAAGTGVKASGADTCITASAAPGAGSDPGKSSKHLTNVSPRRSEAVIGEDCVSNCDQSMSSMASRSNGRAAHHDAGWSQLAEGDRGVAARKELLSQTKEINSSKVGSNFEKNKSQSGLNLTTSCLVTSISDSGVRARVHGGSFYTANGDDKWVSAAETSLADSDLSISTTADHCTPALPPNHASTRLKALSNSTAVSVYDVVNAPLVTPVTETICLVPSSVSETAQPSLCIISMVSEGVSSVVPATTQHRPAPPPQDSAQIAKVYLPYNMQMGNLNSSFIVNQNRKFKQCDTSFQLVSTNTTITNGNNTKALEIVGSNNQTVATSENANTESISVCSAAGLSGINSIRVPINEELPQCTGTGTDITKGRPSRVGVGKIIKKPLKKRIGLTLGPFVKNNSIERIPFDLYTVNDKHQRIAWKPSSCHKAPPLSPPCQISFRGARRSRRCLALPLPCYILYRKLDCRRHHCHFTLFHPHAWQQQLHNPAVWATLPVRIYADTVMTQDFHHYLRSLQTRCRLKPSQAARHVSGVWAAVLRDRLADGAALHDNDGATADERLPGCGVSCAATDCGSGEGGRGEPLRTQRFRSITSLSKQTVKTLYQRLEEEEAVRVGSNGGQAKRLGGERRKTRTTQKSSPQHQHNVSLSISTSKVNSDDLQLKSSALESAAQSEALFQGTDVLPFSTDYCQKQSVVAQTSMPSCSKFQQLSGRDYRLPEAVLSSSLLSHASNGGFVEGGAGAAVALSPLSVKAAPSTASLCSSREGMVLTEGHQPSGGTTSAFPSYSVSACPAPGVPMMPRCTEQLFAAVTSHQPQETSSSGGDGNSAPTFQQSMLLQHQDVSAAGTVLIPASGGPVAQQCWSGAPYCPLQQQQQCRCLGLGIGVSANEGGELPPPHHQYPTYCLPQYSHHIYYQ